MNADVMDKSRLWFDKGKQDCCGGLLQDVMMTSKPWGLLYIYMDIM